MAAETHIEWTRGDDGSNGATWNPITGCSVISAGCRRCYAMTLAGTRLAHTPSRAGLTQQTSAGPVWTGQVRFNAQWLGQPLQWKRPRRIFVCAHGDLFHENVPDAWIDRIFAVMALAPQHTFMVLTKRSERMRRYFAEVSFDRIIASCRGDEGISLVPRHTMQAIEHHFGMHPESSLRFRRIIWPLPNVWVGVSAEHQEAADARIPDLLQVPVAVRWVSAEPLLGPISFRWAPYAHEAASETYRQYLERQGGANEYEALRMLDWIVVGGESGDGARPMNPAWALSLKDQCKAANVPFFFKQWGAHCGGTGQASMFVHLCNGESPAGDRHTVEWPDGYISQPMGKKRAGRLLFGQTYDQMPHIKEAPHAIAA
ncbi:MAG: phage Gp37/Gp68 family protein [Telluria sp.]